MLNENLANLKVDFVQYDLGDLESIQESAGGGLRNLQENFNVVKDKMEPVIKNNIVTCQNGTFKLSQLDIH